MRNLLGTVPSASKDMVAATVRTIFAQPDAPATRIQLHEVVRILETKFPKAAQLLADAEPDVLAHTGFPRAHWRKIASTNPLERINKEIKRRSNVVGIFPDDASVIRLVGAVLLDQHDDWAIAERRYLSEESMALIDATPRRSPPQTHPNCPPPNLTGEAKGHRPTSTTPRGTAIGGATATAGCDRRSPTRLCSLSEPPKPRTSGPGRMKPAFQITAEPPDPIRWHHNADECEDPSVYQQPSTVSGKPTSMIDTGEDPRSPAPPPGRRQRGRTASR